MEDFMANGRAGVVSVRDLSKAVDKAVRLATERHKLKPEGLNLLLNWKIIGRVLRDFGDVNAAFEFASAVTKRVEVHGIKAQPACAKIGPHDILVGFIERAQLPIEIGG
jgi:hypothetical protein